MQFELLPQIGLVRFGPKLRPRQIGFQRLAQGRAPIWIALPAPLPQSSMNSNAVSRAAKAEIAGYRPIITRRV